MKNPPTWPKVVIALGSLVIVVLVIMIIGGSTEDGDSPLPEDQVAEVGFLASNEISDFLANGRYSMIEFGGRSCTPCKQMQPILTELKSAYSEVIDIVNFYLEDDFSVADTFEISLMPTQIVFGRDGNELSRHVGVWAKEEIVEEYRRLQIIE